MHETQRTPKNICLPLSIINVMLDSLGYKTILDFYHKHILDVAAGNGGFLIEIITRTINELTKFKKDKEFIKTYLEQYLHIIECNPDYFSQLKNILDVTASRFGIFNVKWDLNDQSAIENQSYVGMMDFVIGNIFYLSIENLKLEGQAYTSLVNKQTQASKVHHSKTTEFYFEYGIKCLKSQTGKLIYLSSNTWLRSQNYRGFRGFLNQQVTLDFIVNFNFHDVFENINLNPAMTMISRHPNPSQEILLFEYGFHGMWSNDILKLSDGQDPIRLPLTGKNIEIDATLATFTFKEAPKPVNLSSFIVTHHQVLPEWEDWLIDIYKTNQDSWAKLIYPYDDDYQFKDVRAMPLSLQSYLKKKLGDCDLTNPDSWYATTNDGFLKSLSESRYVVSKTYDPVNEVFVRKILPKQAVLDGFLLYDTHYDSHEINHALQSHDFLVWIQSFGKTTYGSQYQVTIEMLNKYLSWWFTLKTN